MMNKSVLQRLTYRDLSDNALKNVIAERLGWGVFINDQSELKVHDNNGNVWVTPDNATMDNVWQRTPLLDIGFAINTVMFSGYKLILTSPSRRENKAGSASFRATIETKTGKVFLVENHFNDARCIMEAWLYAIDSEAADDDE